MEDRKLLTGAELSLPAQYSGKFIAGAEQAIAVVRAYKYRTTASAVPTVSILDRKHNFLGGKKLCLGRRLA